MVLLGIVDDRALELRRVDVAHDADRQVGLLEDERRCRRLRDALLEHLVQLEQVQQLALEVGALGALGGGADDRARALEVELGRLLAQPVALLVVEPPGDPDALAERRQHHVAAGDRQVHRQAGALRLQRVLDDLDDDLLARLEHVGDLPAVPAATAAPAARCLDAGQHDLVDVEKPVLLQSDVDERRLEPGEHVVDAALVDVADDRAGAAALEIQLGDVVAGRRVGGLTPAPGRRRPGLRSATVPVASSSATRVSPRSTLTNTCFFNCRSVL